MEGGPARSCVAGVHLQLSQLGYDQETTADYQGCLNVVCSSAAEQCMSWLVGLSEGQKEGHGRQRLGLGKKAC